MDGAAAAMLMTAEKAEELGLEPMASVVSTAVAGSETLFMLMGPVPAMHKALERAEISMDEVVFVTVRHWLPGNLHSGSTTCPG